MYGKLKKSGYAFQEVKFVIVKVSFLIWISTKTIPFLIEEEDRFGHLSYFFFSGNK